MSASPETPQAINLFTPEFLNDPYPTYRRFLDAGPIHYVHLKSPAWALFTHADCSSAIRDARLSANRARVLLFGLPPDKKAEFAELIDMLSRWMVFFDAPEHTRLRKLMNKSFSPAVVQTLRPHVESIVDRLLAPLRDASEADILRDLAYPLPVRVISNMLGVPEELQEYFIQWSNSIANFLGSPQRSMQLGWEAQEAVLALTEFFRAAVAERRRQKGSDLISLLIDIEEDGEVLTEDELYAQCVMLLAAGHETTRNLIGNGMFTLLRHPEAMAELRDHPQIIASAVEELLRFESPLQSTSRVAKEDTEVCGKHLRPGDALVFMLGAANRDAAQFKDPDTLNLKRLNNQHLAFGVGAHFCLGNQVARLEGQVAILKLVQQFPSMRLTAERPEWVPNFAFRGLKSLPVAL